MTRIISDRNGRQLIVGSRLFFPRTMAGQPATTATIIEIAEADDLPPQIIVRYADNDETDVYWPIRLDVELYRAQELCVAEKCTACEGWGYTYNSDDNRVECPYCDGSGGTR